MSAGSPGFQNEGKGENEEYRHAVTEAPSYEKAYWALLGVSVYSRQYDVAVNTLDSFECRFGYSFDPSEIAGINGNETFAQSSVFMDWKLGIRP